MGAGRGTLDGPAETGAGEKGKEHYHSKDTYIDAIEYIKDVGIRDQRIQEFFATSNSRSVIDKYLEELITLLNLGNISYVREKRFNNVKKK